MRKFFKLFSELYSIQYFYPEVSLYNLVTFTHRVYVTLTSDGSVASLYTSTEPSSLVYHKAVIAALSGSYQLVSYLSKIWLPPMAPPNIQ